MSLTSCTKVMIPLKLAAFNHCPINEYIKNAQLGVGLPMVGQLSDKKIKDWWCQFAIAAYIHFRFLTVVWL